MYEINRGYGAVEDFLTSDKRADVIITNPPFALLKEFINHGLKQTNRFLIFFAKIQLLETKSRAEILKNSPLRYVYVHSERQQTWRNNIPVDENGKPWATTLCMAWFVWDKEYKGEPILRFIHGEKKNESCKNISDNPQEKISSLRIAYYQRKNK